MEDIAIAFRDWKVLKASGRQAYQDFSNALLARSHACAGREAWFGDGLHSSGLPRAMTLRAEADAINRSIDLEEVVTGMRAVAKHMIGAADLILEELKQQEEQQDEEDKGCCEVNNMERTPSISLPSLPNGYSYLDAVRTAREASIMMGDMADAVSAMLNELRDLGPYDDDASEGIQLKSRLEAYGDLWTLSPFEDEDTFVRLKLLALNEDDSAAARRS